MLNTQRTVTPQTEMHVGAQGAKRSTLQAEGGAKWAHGQERRVESLGKSQRPGVSRSSETGKEKG